MAKTLTVKYYGDEYRGRMLNHAAAIQLAQLHTSMKFQDLDQDRRLTILPDGSKIECTTVFGVSTVKITVPSLHEEKVVQEHDIPEEPRQVFLIKSTLLSDLVWVQCCKTNKNAAAIAAKMGENGRRVASAGRVAVWVRDAALEPHAYLDGITTHTVGPEMAIAYNVTPEVYDIADGFFPACIESEIAPQNLRVIKMDSTVITEANFYTGGCTIPISDNFRVVNNNTFVSFSAQCITATNENKLIFREEKLFLVNDAGAYKFAVLDSGLNTISIPYEDISSFESDDMLYEEARLTPNITCLDEYENNNATVQLSAYPANYVSTTSIKKSLLEVAVEFTRDADTGLIDSASKTSIKLGKGLIRTMGSEATFLAGGEVDFRPEGEYTVWSSMSGENKTSWFLTKYPFNVGLFTNSRRVDAPMPEVYGATWDESIP